MAVKEGDKIPELTLKTPNADGMPEDITTSDIFSGKKVVVFAVPGAFTPLCSAQHLPGFIDKTDAFKAKGVDTIVCVSVNDAFVMGAWAKDKGSGDKILMIGDGSGDFTKAMGLEMDGSKFGMGTRSQRYAAVVEDGVITKLAVEAPMKFEVSGADSILAAL